MQPPAWTEEDGCRFLLKLEKGDNQFGGSDGPRIDVTIKIRYNKELRQFQRRIVIRAREIDCNSRELRAGNATEGLYKGAWEVFGRALPEGASNVSPTQFRTFSDTYYFPCGKAADKMKTKSYRRGIVSKIQLFGNTPGADIEDPKGCLHSTRLHAAHFRDFKVTYDMPAPDPDSKDPSLREFRFYPNDWLADDCKQFELKKTSGDCTFGGNEGPKVAVEIRLRYNDENRRFERQIEWSAIETDSDGTPRSKRVEDITTGQFKSKWLDCGFGLPEGATHVELRPATFSLTHRFPNGEPANVKYRLAAPSGCVSEIELFGNTPNADLSGCGNSDNDITRIHLVRFNEIVVKYRGDAHPAEQAIVVRDADERLTTEFRAALLDRFAPVFIPNRGEGSAMVSLHQFADRCKMLAPRIPTGPSHNWLQEGFKEQRTLPGRDAAYFRWKEVLRFLSASSANQKRSVDWEMDQDKADHSEFKKDAARINSRVRRAHGEGAHHVLGRVRALPESQLYSVTYFLFFAKNRTGAIEDIGDHTGDWIGIDLRVRCPERSGGVARVSDAEIVNAIYHNHGRMLLATPAGGLGIRLTRDGRPHAFLEEGTNEPWPTPGLRGNEGWKSSDGLRANKHFGFGEGLKEGFGNENALCREREGLGVPFDSQGRVVDIDKWSGDIDFTDLRSINVAFFMLYRGEWGEEDRDPHNWLTGFDATNPESPRWQGKAKKMWDLTFNEKNFRTLSQWRAKQ